MKRTFLAAPLAVLLTAGAALAAAPTIGTSLSTDIDSVRAALVDQGYDVREIEFDDGRIEAYIEDADGRWEIEVDRNSGLIVAIEVRSTHDTDS